MLFRTQPWQVCICILKKKRKDECSRMNDIYLSDVSAVRPSHGSAAQTGSLLERYCACHKRFGASESGYSVGNGNALHSAKLRLYKRFHMDCRSGLDVLPQNSWHRVFLLLGKTLEKP